jgi:imidazolonepropionase-like amidohydrolase
MKKYAACLCAVLVASLTSASQALAQDIVISNARILDGKGGVIERGAVVVRDGRIVSVSAAAPAGGATRIDAAGMTVMPGFIDAHRHLIEGDPQQWLDQRAASSMREFLEAGFTTVLSAIDPTEQILELRRRTASGETLGPRLVVAGFVPLSRAVLGGGGVDPARTDPSRPPLRPTEPAPGIPHEDTRTAVRALAAAGVDAIKTLIIVTPGGPERETLSIVAEEARKLGVMSITHAVSVEDTVAAVQAGTHYLVHTPHIGQLDEPTAKMIAAAGIPMTSTLGVFVPFFSADNVPLFRDREPFPWNTLSSAGQGPVNARLLWEAGITYAYGTDTSWSPRDSLAHELKPLRLVFSGEDIIEILTSNAAAAVGLPDEIGTLEPGKAADIVILDGDPIADVDDLLNVEVVIKNGAVVVDKRAD